MVQYITKPMKFLIFTVLSYLNSLCQKKGFWETRKRLTAFPRDPSTITAAVLLRFFSAAMKQLNNAWDYESVCVSKKTKIGLILCSLVEKLRTLGHDEGNFCIEAFVGTYDPDRIGPDTLLGLLEHGIRVTSAKNGKKQSADKLIKKRAREWAEKCPNGEGVFILFASDRGYVKLMKEMLKRNFKTVLIYSKGKIGSNLEKFPHPHVSWEDLLAEAGAYGRTQFRPVAKDFIEAEDLGLVAREEGKAVCASVSNVVWFTETVVLPETDVIMPNEGRLDRTREEENFSFAN